MKQSITLHIYQYAATQADATLDKYDYVAHGFEASGDDDRIKIGEVKVEVDSASAQALQATKLATLRAKLGRKSAECNEIERQIQNLLAIEA